LQDTPFYEELKRRGHKAAKWWLLGEILCYLGFLASIVLAFRLLLALIGCLLGGRPWIALLYSFLFMVLCVLVIFIGDFFKGKSYKMAKEDGIDVNDF
jgi:hypothetical protein